MSSRSVIPRMRASMIQGNITDLDLFEPELSARIRGAIPPGMLAQIAASSRIAWLPLEFDIQISQIVGDIAGRQRRFDWARTCMARSLSAPLLKPLLHAAFRLFGASPGALFRAIPSGWHAVYRNVGNVTHESGPDSARIIVADLPEIAAHDSTYLPSLCGTFTALFDAAQTPGVVELAELDSRTRRVEYLARWGGALD